MNVGSTSGDRAPALQAGLLSGMLLGGDRNGKLQNVRSCAYLNCCLCNIADIVASHTRVYEDRF